jgi:hypothetical protein
MTESEKADLLRMARTLESLSRLLSADGEWGSHYIETCEGAARVLRRESHDSGSAD